MSEITLGKKRKIYDDKRDWRNRAYEIARGGGIYGSVERPKQLFPLATYLQTDSIEHELFNGVGFLHYLQQLIRCLRELERDAEKAKDGVKLYSLLSYGQNTTINRRYMSDDPTIIPSSNLIVFLNMQTR